jgi:uncharacterized protein
MKELFLDSAYVLAIELENDQYHSIANEHWRILMAPNPARLVTTSFVFDEIVTFLSARGRRERAMAVGEWLLSSKYLHFIDVDRNLFEDGWTFFRRHNDKLYSLTDCISFVVMQRLGITTALTFDHHFQQAGFNTEP